VQRIQRMRATVPEIAKLEILEKRTLELIECAPGIQVNLTLAGLQSIFALFPVRRHAISRLSIARIFMSSSEFRQEN
jgi:hypothetical protein